MFVILIFDLLLVLTLLGSGIMLLFLPRLPYAAASKVRWLAWRGSGLLLILTSIALAWSVYRAVW